MRLQCSPKRRAPAIDRSAEEAMSTVSDVLIRAEGAPSCGSRAGMDSWGRQVVAPVKHGDAVARSSIYPRDIFEQS